MEEVSIVGLTGAIAIPASPGVTVSGPVAGILEGQSDEWLAAQSMVEPQAFNELVLRYQNRVYGVAYRMLGDSGDAHDLAQETFVRAFRRLETFDCSRRFAPWLFRIAVNLCLDHRSRQMHVVPLGDLELVEKGASPEASAIREEKRTLIQKAILDLPLKYRAVIVLRHIEELTYEEIAAALDLPVNTVRTHLFRARAALRKALTDNELLQS
jgi:RNA polymerase sigma-70 factor (ECF subfamily)